MLLVAEYQCLRAGHTKAIQLREARATLGASVLRVFAEGTRQDLIDVFGRVPIGELGAIDAEDRFRPWFERQLDATVRAIARRNADNARIQPGANTATRANCRRTAMIPLPSVRSPERLKDATDRHALSGSRAAAYARR
jgi:hypothetical protein